MPAICFARLVGTMGGWSDCDGCGNWSTDGYSVNYSVYCSDCFYESYTYCGDCSEVVCLDDCVAIDDCNYCEDCRGSNSPGDWVGCDEYNQVGSPRRYGIELETHSCDNYSSYNHAAWGCKDDYSIAGKEFCSTILHGNDGLAAVDDICDYANRNGWTVDYRCGYHLHLDMSKENVDGLKAIALAYHTTYKVWRDFVDLERSYNHHTGPLTIELGEYLKPNDIEDWRLLVISQARTRWANWQAYQEHRTLEIRLHEGTLDGGRVKNWVRAHCVFADWASGVGYNSVRAALWGRDTNEQQETLADIFGRAGCSDLIEFYDIGVLVC